MMEPLLKVTLLLAAASLALRLLRTSTAAIRHLVCVVSFAGALILAVLPVIPVRFG